MMQLIDNNVMRVSALSISAKGIIPEKAILKDYRYEYERDSDGRVGERIIGIKYNLISLKDFSTFTIKVPLVTPVIGKEELESSEQPIEVLIPVEQTEVKLWKVEYGKAFVTFTAPILRLSQQ